MANLKAGTMIAGSLIWNAGNLPFKVFHEDLYYKDFKIYHEHSKPTPTEIGAVSNSGDTMNGNLTIRHEDNVELRLNTTNSKNAQLFLTETNQLNGTFFRYKGDNNDSIIGIKKSGIDRDIITIKHDEHIIKLNSFPIVSLPQSEEPNSLTRRDYIQSLDYQNIKIFGDQRIDGIKTFLRAPFIKTNERKTLELHSTSGVDNVIEFGDGITDYVAKQALITSGAKRGEIQFSWGNTAYVKGLAVDGYVRSSQLPFQNDDLTRKDYVDNNLSTKLDKISPSVGIENVSSSSTQTDWDTFIPDYFKLHTSVIHSPTTQSSHGFFIPHQSTSGTRHGTQFAARDNKFYLRSRENDLWQPWNRLYTTEFKPTWDDIGGQEFFNQTENKVNVNSEKWLQVASNKGVLPFTNNNGSIGIESQRFNDAWINNYFGSEIELMDSTTDNVLNLTSQDSIAYIRAGDNSVTSPSGTIQFSKANTNQDPLLGVHFFVNDNNLTINGNKVFHEDFLPTLDHFHGTAENSEKLDGLDSTQFLRSDIDSSTTGNITFEKRNKSIVGLHNVNKINQIWSISNNSSISEEGDTFGNLTGLAYKNQANISGGLMAQGDQLVWTSNGSPQVSLGNNGIWTQGELKAANFTLTRDGNITLNNKALIGGIENGWIKLNPNFDFLNGVMIRGRVKVTMLQGSASDGDELTRKDYVDFELLKKLNTVGGTLSGSLAFTDDTTPSESTVPTQLGYGCLSSVSNLKLIANSDKTGGTETNEFVHLAAGYGLNPSTAEGVVIKPNSFTFNNNEIYHEGRKPSPNDIGAVPATVLNDGMLFTNNAYNGIYWGSKFNDDAPHDGSWGYIRQSSDNGQLELGSDNYIKFYETDTRSLAGTISTNEKYLDFVELRQNGVKVYAPNNKPSPNDLGVPKSASMGSNIGAGNWTTENLISWLDSQGAFNGVAWVWKSGWSYGDNPILDTGDTGTIHLAGAVIECFGSTGARHIRITTAPTTSGASYPKCEFVYYNHGDSYSPGWTRTYNTANKITPSELVGDGLLLPSDSFTGLYWGEKHSDDAAHDGSWAYVRRSGSSQGELEIGSDNIINFYETDTRTLAGKISTNDKYIDFFEVRQNGEKVYSPNNKPSALDLSALPLSGGDLSGNIGRTSHSNGFLVGSYNNIGANANKSNPIYSIGSSYKPLDDTLDNMYGIGYCHSQAETTFIPDSLRRGGAGWGMYVAADGDARIFLDATSGNVSAIGQYYADNGKRVYHEGYKQKSYNTLWRDTSGLAVTGTQRITLSENMNVYSAIIITGLVGYDNGSYFTSVTIPVEDWIVSDTGSTGAFQRWGMGDGNDKDRWGYAMFHRRSDTDIDCVGISDGKTVYVYSVRGVY
ncbi:hypothetical protein [Vibrio harveyi]|uniref:hypothetical protein n=1 Tax=Vibrio harveyi TaxID=669 RepID=UPI003CF26C8B